MNTDFDEPKIPSAPFTIPDSGGRMIFLTDAPDKMLKNRMLNRLRHLRRTITEICALKKEMERREYEGSVLENFSISKDFNIFQMATHQTLVGVHKFNWWYLFKKLMLFIEARQ